MDDIQHPLQVADDGHVASTGARARPVETAHRSAEPYRHQQT